MAIHVALHHKTHYRYDRRVIARTSGRPAAAGAALPHADPRVFAEGSSRRTTSSTGSRIRKATISRGWSSRSRPRSSSWKSIWSPKWRSSIRSIFSWNPTRNNIPFPTTPRSPANCAPFSKPNRPGPMLSAFLARVPRESTRTIDFLVGLNQRVQNEIGYVIRMEPGVQTCEETLTPAHRLLPRFGLAAGPDHAPSGTRGALRFRLSDSTRGGREAARRTGRTHRRFHRSARLGRSVSAGRRLGRIRSHVRAARRRRSHSARLHAGRRQRRAHLRPARPLQHGVPARDDGAADLRIASRHQAVHRGAVAAKSKRSAIRWMPICAPATCG